MQALYNNIPLGIISTSARCCNDQTHLCCSVYHHQPLYPALHRGQYLQTFAVISYQQYYDWLSNKMFMLTTKNHNGSASLVFASGT